MRKLILLISLLAGSVAIASAQNGVVSTYDTVINGIILTTVEQMPEYPGGMTRLVEYLSANIEYPERARKSGTMGKVIVKFVVSKTGRVTQATLVRDIGEGCGDEALRVVRAMPRWKPGMQNGAPVNVYYTLPISFRY